MEHLGQFIINHWHLWLALIIIILFIVINETIAQKKKAKEISPQSTVDLINHQGAKVIDMRDKESFKNGHIIDAVNASADDFEKGRMDKYKDKPLVLVCARGLQSATFAAKLQSQGFQQVMVLNGGMNNWQAANMPIVKGKE
ncbi:rhodanese-like domain-containing protein [Legionella israelensis]|uniref:Rhodanese-like domain-containing protein n=1 Tax=Legionella israelensis TaxID=454 RepID=A0AAX1EIN9_9GAMM|nr:rhodanese-like domain-containing protein [Legionella israelensis]QBR84922.1 rhodanese-like domain-containing protein [Legionella israelensis]